MGSILEDAAIPALNHLHVRFYADREQGLLMAPICLADARVLVVIHANDGSQDAIVDAELPLKVPRAQQPIVALHLAELNGRLFGVSFSMCDGIVHIDACVLLKHVSDPEFHIGRAFCRVCVAVEEEHAQIARLAQPTRRQRPSRLDREVAEIVRQLDS